MKTTHSFGVVARVATAIVAVTFGSGCTNPSPSDEQACNGFCPTGDGNISPLTVDGDIGQQPCNNACSESFVCLNVDRDGDGTPEETCVLATCGDDVLDSGEDCDGGESCLATCYCPDDMVADLAMGCETPCFPVCLADDRSPMICGDDGCGGSCGDCLAGTACSADQTTCDCVPDCTNDSGVTLVCGSNGCGGTCGTCEATFTCSADQTACEPAPPCTPDCTGLICGDDGCEGSCGDCPAGTACNADQTACDCVPDCTNDSGVTLACGSNGCGGTCGTCEATFTCSADQTACNPPPPEVCDNGGDEDFDGDVDVADSDCLLEEVAALGCYFEFGAMLFIDTAVVSGYQETYPFDPLGTTVGIGINGADAYLRLRISAAALSCSSGQSFTVWPDCGDPGEPWPTGDGMVRNPGQSFSSTAPDWYCFFLAGATE